MKIKETIKHCWSAFKEDFGIFLFGIVGISIVIGNIILYHKGLITRNDFININTMITLVSCAISITSISFIRR